MPDSFEVDSWRFLPPRLARLLQARAEAAPDAVAHDGVAHALAHGKADQARFGLVGKLENVQHEVLFPDRRPRLIDALECATAA